MISNKNLVPVIHFITRAQGVLIIVFVIILLLGKTLVYFNKNVVKDDQLALVISSNQANNYIFMDQHASNITKIVKISPSDQQYEYEKLKIDNLQKCDELNIRDYRENGQSSRNRRIPELDQIFKKSKMEYPSSTKPHQNKQNIIQIFQKDCHEQSTYYNNEIVLKVLLQQIFEHIYPINIITEKYHQHNQLIQEISLNFNINQKHTMNIKKYLESRIPKLLWNLIQQTSLIVDIFIGDQNDLLQQYNSTKILKIRNQGSYKYYIQQTDNYKLIVSGISNIQRLINFYYILKFSKVDLLKVSQIGSIIDYQDLNSKLLLDQLHEIEIAPKIAYIGNRRQALIEIAKRLYIDELRHITDNFEAYAISLLQIRNSLITKKINGIFRYSYLIIHSNESYIGIICFRMPNGQLSYEATKNLLAIGVKQFFMVGAGGAINPNLVIGDYIQIVQAQYNQQSAKVNPEQFINLINFQIVPDGESITIDSPLEETQNWLFNNRNMDCVDIETFHILKALEDSPSDVRYLPGIFISDVLTSKPLQDKIGINNAYRAFSNFMQSTFIYLHLR